MVVLNLKDLFDVSSKICNLTLPKYKQNGFTISFYKNDVIGIEYNRQQPVPFANSEVINTRITTYRRLSSEHKDCKAIYEVVFDVSDHNINFKPGDTIGIIPKNRQCEVQTIINHLNISSQADQQYVLSVDSSQKGVRIPGHIPVKSTIRHVLMECVDLRSTVKKLFLLALSRYTENEMEKNVLEFLCSTEGSALYSTNVLNKNICILDIFKIFESCRPPIEVLFAFLPRLLPRPYSIASSGIKDPNKIKICFSVIDIGSNKKGLTTGWLEDMLKKMSLENAMENLRINSSNKESEVQIYLRKNMTDFHIPRDLNTDLILIGPGTGVAPFIGFLEERECLSMHMHVSNSTLGQVWLFHGCRNPMLDFIYEKELKDFIENGVLNKLEVAVSRIENSPIKYVQDALLYNSEDVAKLIKGGASIYVCGDKKIMTSQVRETILKCLIEHWDLSPEESERYIVNMEKDKRYLVDMWS